MKVDLRRAGLSISFLIGLACALGCSGKERASQPDSKATGAHNRPFLGKSATIPGTIEAENFDRGAEGQAYHDLDPENQGEPYQKTAVDVEKRPDASGGHGVGWTRAGEWLAYTVEVTAAGTYTLEIPAATPGTGGTFHVEFNGRDVTGPVVAPNTGSWQKLTTITRPGVKLTAGRQVMRIVMDAESETRSVADIDCIKFTLASAESKER